MNGRHKRGPEHASWKGGRQIHPSGHVIVYAPDYRYPRYMKGYMREHIMVMETHLGRRLYDDEVILHLDGNKTNNDLSNLRLMTRAEIVKLNREKIRAGRWLGNKKRKAA